MTPTRSTGTEYNKRFLEVPRVLPEERHRAPTAPRPTSRATGASGLTSRSTPTSTSASWRGGRTASSCGAPRPTTPIAPYADEIIALPTRFLTEEEGDWAVAFAVPADWEGVHLVCRPPARRGRAQRLHAPHRRVRRRGVAHHLRRCLRPLGAGLPLRRDASSAASSPCSSRSTTATATPAASRRVTDIMMGGDRAGGRVQRHPQCAARPAQACRADLASPSWSTPRASRRA